jgi:hypothetical protein
MIKLMKSSNLNSNMSVDSENFNFLCPTEIRLNKDLLELKKFRMTTKVFNTQFSNIMKDNDNISYKMFVSMEYAETRTTFVVNLIFKKNSFV